MKLPKVTEQQLVELKEISAQAAADAERSRQLVLDTIETKDAIRLIEQIDSRRSNSKEVNQNEGRQVR
jgi:citrate lyase beta subunit